MNFEINFRCLVKSISYITEKLGQKKKNISIAKRAFEIKKILDHF